MFRKVLMLADSGDPNQPALRRSLQCIDDAGELSVFTVAYEPMLEGYLGNTEIYEPLRSRVVKDRLERIAPLASAAERWGVRTSTNAVWAHPLGRAVADEVAARRIDLVVARPAELQESRTPAPTGLSHSVWQLVASCPAPMLVVRSDGQTPYRSIVAAVDPFHAHAKPAALDAEILRVAKALQAETGAALTVLHCYTPPEYFGVDLGPLLAQQTGVREQAVRQLCMETGVPTTAIRVVAGAPHAVIEDLQRRGEADLVVMGGLARGRLAELLIGSTAERVLHQGFGDVLVVKSPQKPATR